ncbi:MAG: hypothetical protein J5898_05755 [Lachnospiraceae bacterium]|nr:hypothetical protein [Lachnospiraceae bacterium]
MTYRDNEVQILFGGNERLYKENDSYGEYTIKDFKVTSGQDPNGKISKGKVFKLSEDGKATFSVGRKKSGEVADWWKERVKRECNTFNDNPGELNFAFKVDLNININSSKFGKHRVTYRDLCIAQGNNGRNNWWFGGTQRCYYHHIYNDDIDSSRDDAVICFGEFSDGGKKYVLRTFVDRSKSGASVNTYTFYLDAVLCLDNANWLSGLSKEIQLKNIMMPGSHDAGMSELHHTNFVAGFNKAAIKTQKNCIYEQLLSGCRYFDIRVDYDHDELVTYHRDEGVITGLGAGGQSISDVFMQAEDFLNQYDSEFIVFKVSHFRSASGHDPKKIAEKMVDFVKGRNRIFKSGGSNLHELKRSDLAGKILTVFADESCMPEYDSKAGIFKYHDVGDSAEKSVPANQLNVYDHYSNTDSFETMKKDQLDKWKKNAGQSSTKLFLLSWTLTLQGVGGNASGSIEKLAQQANSKLKEVLKEQYNSLGKDKMPHIVYIDFIDPEMCGIIINQAKEYMK